MKKENKAYPYCSLFFMTMLVISVVFSALPSNAGLIRVESESLGSFRNGADLKPELPLYEFLGASYVSDAHDLEINTNLSLFTDPKRLLRDFDLFLLDLTYRPIPEFITLRFGRSFDTYRSVRTMTSDSVGAELTLFDKKLTLGAFGGNERELVLGRFTPSASFWGYYASYKTADLFPIFVSARFRHRNYTITEKVHENTLQTSLSKLLPGDWSPELLLDAETQISPKAHLNRLEGGMDLYPTYRTSLRWRALTYDVLPETGIEQPIYSIFSQGRLYEALGQLEYRFSSTFSTSFSMALDNYVLQSPERTTGTRLDLGAKYIRDTFTVGNSIYLFYSYGGKVHGNRLFFIKKLSDRLDIQGAVELTYYKKVTSSRQTALNTQLGANFAFSNRFKLNTAAEVNSNNSLRYDVRALIKLIYLLWAET